MNIITANRYLKDKGAKVEIIKGRGYFYFAGCGTIPKSIYTNSIKHITVEDLDFAIAESKNDNK